VLGGNNSSEIRVGLSGLIYQEPYPKLGKLVDELGSVGHWTLWEANRILLRQEAGKILDIIAKNPEKKIHNAGPATNYGDDKKRMVIEAEPNISLFLTPMSAVLKRKATGLLQLQAETSLQEEN
jgi:hypothetical protein